jgi:prepilin-type N-terminal cleavage/methylation domain-containing protein
MSSLFRKTRSGERGFTLVELLVVLGILVALAAVVVPSVSLFIGRGDTTANTTEESTVQAAMDLYMAESGNATVAANAVATNDFSGTSPTLFPTYLRQNPTKCQYTWDVAGFLSQGTCS